MSRYTVTRFVAAIPRHGVNSPFEDALGPRLSGQPVRLMLPANTAVTPNRWTCGTEYEWNIHPDDATRLGIFPGMAVCEHQVEID